MQRLFSFLVSGGLATLLWVGVGSAQAQVYVNGSVAAALAPGVYGRIDMGVSEFLCVRRSQKLAAG